MAYLNHFFDHILYKICINVPLKDVTLTIHFALVRYLHVSKMTGNA